MYALIWLEVQVSRFTEPAMSQWDALFNILGRWVIAWAAAPVLVSIALVDTDVVDEHLAREHEVLEVLRLETR